MNKTTKILDFCRLGGIPSKKGVSVLLMVFEIAAALFTIYLMTSVAIDLSGDTYAQRMRTASEISLLTNALISAPGDIIAYYPGDLTQYTITADKNSIVLYEKKEGLALQSARKGYVSLAGIQLSGKVENQKLVHFKKQGQKLSFSAEEAKIETQIDILTVDTKYSDWPSKKIAIVPKTIDGQLNTLGEAIVININQKSGKETAALSEARDIIESDMIIEIRRINKTGTTNALISKEETFLRQNKKLAGLLLKKIKSADITQSDILLAEQYTLSQGNIAVILEIDSNIADQLNQDLIKVIPEAIEEYYE